MCDKHQPAVSIQVNGADATIIQGDQIEQQVVIGLGGYPPADPAKLRRVAIIVSAFCATVLLAAVVIWAASPSGVDARMLLWLVALVLTAALPWINYWRARRG